MQIRRGLQQISSSDLRAAALFSGGMAAVMVFCFVLSTLMASPVRMGVTPGETTGLIGMLGMPLLHGSLGHLLHNLPPLFLLTTALWALFPSCRWWVLFAGWLLPGLFVWFIGESGSHHIGASGLVFTLFGFLALSGLVRRESTTLGVSMVTLFYYGGMLSGILPTEPRVSWEAHLGGLIVGVLAAVLLRHRDLPPAKQYSWELEDEDEALDGTAEMPVEDAPDFEPRPGRYSGQLPDSGHKH